MKQSTINALVFLAIVAIIALSFFGNLAYERYKAEVRAEAMAKAFKNK